MPRFIIRTTLIFRLATAAINSAFVVSNKIRYYANRYIITYSVNEILLTAKARRVVSAPA